MSTTASTLLRGGGPNDGGSGSERPGLPGAVPPAGVQQPTRPVGPSLPAGLVREMLAVLALATYTAVVAAGFARVFTGWDFFDDLLVLTVVGHGLAFGLRRLSVPLWAGLPIVAATLAWLIGFVYLRSTYTALVPTGDTWRLLRLELDLVGEQFSSAVAPVAHIGGWAILAAIGIALVVLLSDAFAFRAFARAEALVPGGVLFVFVAALGSDRLRVPLAGALVAAGVVATVALRAMHAPRPAAVITAGGRRASESPVSTVLGPALLTAAVVALAAMFVGPRLPGAGADALYDPSGGGSDGSLTEVVSPLVDIRSRLTNQSPRELFSVTATTASYWRSAALPEFDGTTWGLPERRLSEVDGNVDGQRPGTTPIRQTVVVSALGGQLIPAAADPSAASGSDGLRWNADSATLVETDGALETGDTYEILSYSPRFTVDQLRAATSVSPGDDVYFELPDDFPSVVETTARSVVGDAATPYDAARRLQDWFRDNFDYSLEVPAGHSTTAIEAFLVNRVGYCEQFSGTYAAMMRSIGIPARVAVGFTQGDAIGAPPNGTGGQTYSVLGRNAHAWPEVWFDGLGWVPFEPTPGRGAPGAEGYTEVPPEQEEGPLDPLDDLAGGEAAPAPTTTIPPAPGADDAVPDIQGGPATTLPDLTVTPGGDGGSSDSGSGFSVPWRGLAIVAALVMIGLLPALVRRVRRRPVSDARVELQRLWARATGSLADVGVGLTPDLTPTEAATVTAARFPVASRPVESLARTVDEVTFSRDGDERLGQTGPYGVTTLEQCGIWTRQIDKAVADSSTPFERIRRYVTRWS
ncbi:MAG: transglutaminaseTgpA domain-containing protein [Actinomycetota bacterium]